MNQQSKICGYSSSVERQLPKLNRRVRLPLSAPRKRGSRRLPLFRGGIRMKGVERSNPTARRAVGRRHPRRRILCFAAGKTQTTPFIRSIVGDPSARRRNGSRLMRLPFLRLCSVAPPLPARSAVLGSRRLPFFLIERWRLILPFHETEEAEGFLRFVSPIHLIGQPDHSALSR